MGDKSTKLDIGNLSGCGYFGDGFKGIFSM